MWSDTRSARVGDATHARPVREHTILDDDVPYNSSIGLFLTKRCPLRCAHCAVGSSPEDPDPADADVLRWAQALARSTHLQHVCITGGEPFLKPDLLHQIAILFLAAGKAISVITSGFWATDVVHAGGTLRRVFPAGTPFRLWLSLDPFHSAHLSARHYRAAINAAYALQIPVCVTATYARDPQEALRFIDMTIDDTAARRRVAKIRAQPLFRVGRGAQLPCAASASAALPRGVCGTCIGHVDAEGRVMACCSVFDAAAGNPLRLGQIDEQSIQARDPVPPENACQHVRRLPLRLRGYPVPREKTGVRR
jgi:hypothetical protein